MNRLLRVFLDISSRALGMTCVTSDCPSASIRVSRGPTTVVFPAPMIICCTLLCPFTLTLSTNHATISTCLFRSSRSKRNSNTRKRGSYSAAGTPPALACFM